MSSQFCIVLTTVGSEQNKTKIVEAVLSNKLAACIQSMPIESHYVWDDEVCCDRELLLIMKTTRSCYATLEQVIVESHEYEVPQVVQVPFVDGFNPYLTWIEENTRS
jgi:periplasmic divalent cation tolerance protein